MSLNVILSCGFAKAKRSDDACSPLEFRDAEFTNTGMDYSSVDRSVLFSGSRSEGSRARNYDCSGGLMPGLAFSNELINSLNSVTVTRLDLSPHRGIFEERSISAM